MIVYECVSPQHRRASAADGGLVTIHQNEWAYCDAEPARGDHEWRKTDGVTLEQIRARKLLVRGAVLAR